MNLYRRNKKRTDRKLIGTTDGLSISHGTRHVDLGQNFPAGKTLGISFSGDESFIVEMSQEDALRLLISLTEFVKK